MHSWFSYLKRELSREQPKDRIAGEDGYSGIRANLKNLRPFIVRHWRKGVPGEKLTCQERASVFG